MDVASMCETSTKVFVLEVMGRHAGWIAAAGGLAAGIDNDLPLIILFPEITFNKKRFLALVREKVREYGYVTIVVSEGVRDFRGRFLADAGTRDAFGHAQLGGVAPVVAGMVKEILGYKYHWAVADYLQRSARHLASLTDIEQAYAVGEAAVQKALEGKNSVMVTIKRKPTRQYRWETGEVSLARVANREKLMPRSYISKDGFGITQRCRAYLEPLIVGEDSPEYRNGLPVYANLKKLLVKSKLPRTF
jgi:6-phosphofructokinase 1